MYVVGCSCVWMWVDVVDVECRYVCMITDQLLSLYNFCNIF